MAVEEALRDGIAGRCRRRRVLYDLTQKALPILLLIVCLMIGTVVLIYSLSAHKTVPPAVAIALVVTFAIIVILIFAGHLSLYLTGDDRWKYDSFTESKSGKSVDSQDYDGLWYQIKHLFRPTRQKKQKRSPDMRRRTMLKHTDIQQAKILQQSTNKETLTQSHSSPKYVENSQHTAAIHQYPFPRPPPIAIAPPNCRTRSISASMFSPGQASSIHPHDSLPPHPSPGLRSSIDIACNLPQRPSVCAVSQTDASTRELSMSPYPQGRHGVLHNVNKHTPAEIARSCSMPTPPPKLKQIAHRQTVKPESHVVPSGVKSPSSRPHAQHHQHAVTGTRGQSRWAQPSSNPPGLGTIIGGMTPATSIGSSVVDSRTATRRARIPDKTTENAVVDTHTKMPSSPCVHVTRHRKDEKSHGSARSQQHNYSHLPTSNHKPHSPSRYEPRMKTVASTSRERRDILPPTTTIQTRDDIPARVSQSESSRSRHKPFPAYQSYQGPEALKACIYVPTPQIEYHQSSQASKYNPPTSVTMLDRFHPPKLSNTTTQTGETSTTSKITRRKPVLRRSSPQNMSQKQNPVSESLLAETSYESLKHQAPPQLTLRAFPITPLTAEFSRPASRYIQHSHSNPVPTTQSHDTMGISSLQCTSHDDIFIAPLSLSKHAPISLQHVPSQTEKPTRNSITSKSENSALVSRSAPTMTNGLGGKTSSSGSCLRNEKTSRTEISRRVAAEDLARRIEIMNVNGECFSSKTVILAVETKGMIC